MCSTTAECAREERCRSVGKFHIKKSRIAPNMPQFLSFVVFLEMVSHLSSIDMFSDILKFEMMFLKRNNT